MPPENDAPAPAAAPAASGASPAPAGAAPIGEAAPPAADGAAAPAPASPAPGEAAPTPGDAGAADSANAVRPADLTVPEGTALEAGLMSTYAELAQELKLSHDAAQKILDRLAPTVLQNQRATIEKTSKSWAEMTLSDPELGGDKVKEVVAVAERGLGAYGSDKLRELLTATGLANHPEVIRVFHKVGLTVKPDKVLTSGQESASPQQISKVLYPNLA